MIDRIKTFLSLFVTTFLVACAGPVPKIDVSPVAMANVKSIVIIRPDIPTTYTVANFGLVFGLMSGIKGDGPASEQRNMQGRLSKVLMEHGSTIISSLTDGVADQLSQAGFQVQVENGHWEDVDGDLKFTFDKIQSNADAFLVISPTIIGFISSSVTSGYLPTIAAIVTLQKKDNKEMLYRGYHASGWMPDVDGFRRSTAKTTFANFDALMANPNQAAASLSEAATAIATTVAIDLKR